MGEYGSDRDDRSDSSAILLHNLLMTGESFVYWMGHFPAPWGNEIRAGILEASMALFFCIIMLLSMWGGRKNWMRKWREVKHNLYYILVNLLLFFAACVDLYQ